MINKRFPADTTLTKEHNTFLSNKLIDGELYAYLQSHSEVIDGKTVVLKSKLPVQAEICKVISIKSPKTLRVHMNQLITAGFVETKAEEPDRYYLPNKEDIYLLLPLETI